MDIQDKHQPEHREMEFKRLQSLIDARIKYQVDLLEGRPRQTLMELLSSRREFGVIDPRDIICSYLGPGGLPSTSTNDTGEGKIVHFRISTKSYYFKTPGQVMNEFAYDVLEWSQSYDAFSYLEDANTSE